MTTWESWSWTNENYNAGNPFIYDITLATGAQVVSGGDLDGFDLKALKMTFFKAGTVSVDMTCRIYDPPASGTSIGTLRATATETYDSGDYSTGDILEFNFNSAVTLAADDIISIYADNSASSTADNSINCAIKDSDPNLPDADDITNYRFRTPYGWTDAEQYNPSVQYNNEGYPSDSSNITFPQIPQPKYIINSGFKS